MKSVAQERRFGCGLHSGLCCGLLRCALAQHVGDVFGRVLIGRPKVEIVGANLDLTLVLNGWVPMRRG